MNIFIRAIFGIAFLQLLPPLAVADDFSSELRSRAGTWAGTIKLDDKTIPVESATIDDVVACEISNMKAFNIHFTPSELDYVLPIPEHNWLDSGSLLAPIAPKNEIWLHYGPECGSEFCFLKWVLRFTSLKLNEDGSRSLKIEYILKRKREPRTVESIDVRYTATKESLHGVIEHRGEEKASFHFSRID